MIKTIGHLAFTCYDFDKTLDFYTRVLGFEEMFRLYNDDDELWIVYLRVCDEVYIELFPKTGEKPTGGGPFSHLCLEVDDVEIMVKELEERGGALTVPIKTGKDGNRQAWTRDPEGNAIEFMEMAHDSLQMRAIERIKATKIAA